MNHNDRERFLYAFGHLVGSYTPHAHSGDAADLAGEIFEELGLIDSEVMLVEILAEEVSSRYQYIGGDNAN